MKTIIALGLTLTLFGCMGGSSGDFKAEEKESFKKRESLLNECVTIGLAGNKELANYFQVDLEASGFSDEYDTLKQFFEAKSAEFGGEGLGALANESMLYFRTATHYAVLLGYHLASSGHSELNDMKTLFKALTSREISDEEFNALQLLSSDFQTDIEKKAAQFAAIVSSAEVQCL